MFTSDLPKIRATTVATFAGDSAALASHRDPTSVSKNPQIKLKLNPDKNKSVGLTFTTRKLKKKTINCHNR